MFRGITVAVCFAGLLGVPVTSGAQEPTIDPYISSQLDAIETELFGDAYEIELEVDGATWEDHDLMEELLLTLPDGPAPRNYRKLVAGVVGEFRLALSARISGDTLILDDGSSAQSSARKKKAKKKAPKRTHNAIILFDSDGRGQPELISIRGKECVRTLFFPKGEDSGGPYVSSSCAIVK